MKILLATTTFEGKKHCFKEWFDAVKKIDYSNVDVLLVDNSTTCEYADWLKEQGVRVVHLSLEGDNFLKMAQTNEYIRKIFIEGDYDYWFSLESDVLVPPDILSFLTSYKADWVGIPYRNRDKLNFASEFGCSLFSKYLMENTDFKDVPANFTHDSWFDSEKFRRGNFTKVVLYNFLNVKHI